MSRRPILPGESPEMADLRWVALHLLREHARGAYPAICPCQICRAAKRWVPMPEPYEITKVSNHPALARRAR